MAAQQQMGNGPDTIHHHHPAPRNGLCWTAAVAPFVEKVKGRRSRISRKVIKEIGWSAKADLTEWEFEPRTFTNTSGIEVVMGVGEELNNHPINSITNGGVAVQIALTIKSSIIN